MKVFGWILPLSCVSIDSFFLLSNIVVIVVVNIGEHIVKVNFFCGPWTSTTTRRPKSQRVDDVNEEEEEEELRARDLFMGRHITESSVHDQ